VSTSRSSAGTSPVKGPKGSLQSALSTGHARHDGGLDHSSWSGPAKQAPTIAPWPDPNFVANMDGAGDGPATGKPLEITGSATAPPRSETSCKLKPRLQPSDRDPSRRRHRLSKSRTRSALRSSASTGSSSARWRPGSEPLESRSHNKGKGSTTRTTRIPPQGRARRARSGGKKV